MFIYFYQDVVSFYILLIILSVIFFFYIVRNCGVLDIFVNGLIIGSKIIYFSKFYFSCDDGFILRGFIIRQCLVDGIWSGNDIFCEGKVFGNYVFIFCRN